MNQIYLPPCPQQQEWTRDQLNYLSALYGAIVALTAEVNRMRQGMQENIHV